MMKFLSTYMQDGHFFRYFCLLMDGTDNERGT